MDRLILDFCKRYQEKKKLDKDIAEKPVNFLQDYRDRISFRISAYSNNFNVHHLTPYYGESLFFLDEEDLEYLYTKYSKKIQEELDRNIEEMKQEYSFLNFKDDKK